MGTLDNREIENTVEGFAKYKNEIQVCQIYQYDIVGGGSKYSINKIASTIKKNGLEKHVKLHGYIDYEEISEYFEKNNIGVSFIPLTKVYADQPPTKTFEYLVSGMPVIATKNKENISVISDINGVLINDTAGDFYEALKEIPVRKLKWNYITILENSKQYEWENIIVNKLLPYLQNN